MAEQAQKAAVKDLTDSAEFKEAVKQAAADQLAQVLGPDVLARFSAAKEGNIGGDRQFAESLALAFAELSSQDSGRKYVAPKIMQERKEARERMVKLIAETRAKGAKPHYRLTNKVMLDNVLVEPFFVSSDHTSHPTEIIWPGVPNEAMTPVNEPAKAIFAEFMASIGSTEKAVPDEALGVTPGGLVVKGRAVPKRREAAQVAFGQEHLGAPEADQTELGLQVPHKNTPGRYIEKNILGTIAKPAQQAT